MKMLFNKLASSMLMYIPRRTRVKRPDFARYANAHIAESHPAVHPSTATVSQYLFFVN